MKMAELSKETQEEIIQLQNLQRQLQMITNQRQRFDIEVIQTDSALAELEKVDGKAYKAIGTLLIESKAADLKKELNERRKEAVARVDTLKKQEEKLKVRAEELQKSLEKTLGKA